MTASGVAAAPLIGLVRAYQVLVSPLLPTSCRYYPSCSAYGLTALRRFGLWRGVYLAAHRLGRCHPWSAGGVDHVPSTWAERGSPELTRPRLGTDPSQAPDRTTDHGAAGAPTQRKAEQ